MPRLVGFGWFAALLEEQISGAAFSPATNGGGPVENLPIVWTLNGKMFRLGSKQPVCSQVDVVISPASCCRGEPPAA
jgi:hypothetical protein